MTETSYLLQKKTLEGWTTLQILDAPFLGDLKMEKARRKELYPHDKLRIVKKRITTETTVVPV